HSLIWSGLDRQGVQTPGKRKRVKDAAIQLESSEGGRGAARQAVFACLFSTWQQPRGNSISRRVEAFFLLAVFLRAFFLRVTIESLEALRNDVEKIDYFTLGETQDEVKSEIERAEAQIRGNGAQHYASCVQLTCE